MISGRKFTRWLHDRKDASLSFVLERALQQRLERYGRVMELRIDTRQSAAFLKLHLKGELEPVSVTIDAYEIQRDNDQTCVVLKQASASREWLSLVIQEMVIQRPFPIPEQYAGWVKMLL
jgi:hypothetical protein